MACLGKAGEQTGLKAKKRKTSDFGGFLVDDIVPYESYGSKLRDILYTTNMVL